MQPDPTMSLSGRIASIRDSLIEAKRYAASDPVTSRRMIDEAFQALTRGALFRDLSTAYVVQPVCRNLLVCDRALLADPGATAGYLAGIIYELGWLRSGLEREAERANLDRELTEAFCPERRLTP